MNQSEIIEKIKTRKPGDFLDLYRADLYRANLSDANLTRANLNMANLNMANLYGANLYRANLSDANLSDANLTRANLYEANLYEANLYEANLSNIRITNAIGNGKEIKSAQFDTYNVVWTADTLAIGCQQHPISKWKKADPRWIAAMAEDATEWWAKHGEFVLNMIEHSPATGKIIAD